MNKGITKSSSESMMTYLKEEDLKSIAAGILELDSEHNIYYPHPKNPNSL